MCFGGKTPAAETPAAAPAPPLPAADDPEIGASRREESIDAFGQDQPSYRVKRPTTVPPVTPSGPISM